MYRHSNFDKIFQKQLKLRNQKNHQDLRILEKLISLLGTLTEFFNNYSLPKTGSDMCYLQLLSKVY